VIVNYDGGPLTLTCLEHVRATEWPSDRLDIVLVDNASRDGVVDTVRRRWPDVRVIVSDTNLGFAGGTNLGIGTLDGVDHVAIVNNDVFVPEGWLAPLVDVVEADPTVGAACPKILLASRFLEVELEARSTARLGRGDRRELGPRITGAEVDRRDVLDAVQCWHGFWGPERDDTGRATQWASRHAVARVPVGLDDPTPSTIRLRLEAPAEIEVVLRAGGPATTARVTTSATWHDVAVGSQPVDVVNNAGSVLTPEGFGADRGYLERDDGRYDEPADVFAWCGAAAVLRARYLADVGLLDERLFLYYEDLELSWRGRELGWTYRYVPEVVVRHVHSATAGEHSELARYQNERNRLLVLARHRPLSTVARASWRYLLITGSYTRRDVVSPMLHGRRPRGVIVQTRLRAFFGFLRRAPAMRASRRHDARRARSHAALLGLE
jgi:GT2 family glycosyltransferase